MMINEVNPSMAGVNCPSIFTAPALQVTSAGSTTIVMVGTVAICTDEALVAGMSAVTNTTASTTPIALTERDFERVAPRGDSLPPTVIGRERRSPDCQNRPIRNP